MSKLLTSLIAAVVVTAALIALLRPAASAFGLIDQPGGRKTHAGAIPVIGGIAMYLGTLVTLLVFADLDAHRAMLFVGGALMTTIGALDDRFDVPPPVRMIVHLVGAVLLVMGTGFRVGSLGNLFGFGHIALGRLDFLFTLIAAIALMNAFNMLDGVDGIAGGVALVGLAGLSFQLVPVGDEIAVVTVASIGALLGFLAFNLPAGFNRRWLVFMGDAGSALLGFTLAGLALVAIQAREVGGELVPGLPPVVVLWLLPIPIVELFTSTIRRLVTGRSPMQADRGHFHHRLLDAGFSVRAVFLMYMVVSAISAAIGLGLWRAGMSEPQLFYLFAALSIVWLLATHNVRRLVVLLPARLKRNHRARSLQPESVQAETQTHL